MRQCDAQTHAASDKSQHLGDANILCSRHSDISAISKSSSYEWKKQRASKVHGNLLIENSGSSLQSPGCNILPVMHAVEPNFRDGFVGAINRCS